MITYNGLKFAKNDKEMVASLFTGGKTCAGFYKRIKSGYQLMNLQKELTAFVRDDGLLVNAFKFEGKSRYSFGTSSTVEKWLGIAEMKYIEKLALRVVSND